MKATIIALALAATACGSTSTSHEPFADAAPDAVAPEASPPEAGADASPETGTDAAPDASPQDASDAACVNWCVLYAQQTGDGGYNPDGGYGIAIHGICCTPMGACTACISGAGCNWQGVCENP
jgi:hypothetical protein